jgi:ectoine hydroxylase-related dioxygenase (phytanoyl-CoA dioxygenase family)
MERWGDEFLANMSDEQRGWFLEQTDRSGTVLRKLDAPVFHRPTFRRMAQSPRLVAMVGQLIGSSVSVFFSQLFCKPPEVGGPKPVHQDNFYFGPSDPDATLTVWIALDDATIDNGCLFYGDGSQRGPVYPHVAPPGEPFNWQIPREHAGAYPMTPAPVLAGGVSIHHGNTWHQSSSNASTRSRRAAAIHFLRDGDTLKTPALPYDPSFVVKITETTEDQCAAQHTGTPRADE